MPSTLTSCKLEESCLLAQKTRAASLLSLRVFSLWTAARQEKETKKNQKLCKVWLEYANAVRKGSSKRYYNICFKRNTSYLAGTQHYGNECKVLLVKSSVSINYIVCYEVRNGFHATYIVP